jgi:membrane-associated protein
MDLSAVSELLMTWGSPALLLLLLLTGVGSPIPEDLLLLTAGYLVFSGVLNWPPVLVICLAGVVGSDVILFGAGRRFGWRPEGSLDSSVVSPSRLARVTVWFDRIGPSLVFVARLVPGTRALVFVSAGIRGMPASRFLSYDILGAAVWVPLVLWAGYASGEHLGTLDAALRNVQEGAMWLVALAAALMVGWLVWGREESKL